MSPARNYLLSGCKLHPKLGICWQRAGPNEPILQHAARHGFFKAPKEALQRLCKEEGLSKEGTVFDLVCSLLDKLLPDLPAADRARILETRSLVPPDPMPADLSPEVIEEVCGKSDVRDYEERSE